MMLRIIVSSKKGLNLLIVDDVASLVDKSLVRRQDAPVGEPRFAMLEPVREFAREQLEESGETDAAHAAWQARLATWQAEEQRVKALRLLEARHRERAAIAARRGEQRRHDELVERMQRGQVGRWR